MKKYKTAPCPHCGSEQAVIDGAWLRDTRKRAGLTLRQFAERRGVSAAYICDIEKNRRNCLPAMKAAYEALEAI